MTRPRLAFAALLVGFVFLLAYLTAGSIPGTGSDALPDPAETACRAEVTRRVADARFPFPARTDPAEPGLLRGVFDSGEPGSIVRRNYECRVSDAGSAATVDSLRLWQSH